MDIYNKRILMNKFNKGDIVKHKNVEGERFVIETFDNVGLLVGIRRLRDCRLLWVDPECIIVVMNGTDERISESKEKNTCNSMSMNIKKVIFNNPATIVFWSDGSKTVVKSYLDDYDPEKGLAMAIAKKYLGNKGNYYDIFRKWLPKEGDFSKYMNPPISEQYELLTVKQFAEKTGQSEVTIRRDCRKKLHPGAKKVDGKWMIPFSGIVGGNKNDK